MKFLRRQWFLAGLCFVIPLGLCLGFQADPAQMETALGWISSRALTAIVLFLMAFSLNSQQLRTSARYPGPVLWASLVNYGLLPLLGWQCMQLQTDADYQIGIMIAVSVPCTMASASVWTRKANGNDAVSLLVTMITNGTCFLITPLWVAFGTSVATKLSVSAMVARLAVSVLLPCVAGQLLRTRKSLANWATQQKKGLGIVAQSLLLVLVFVAACRSGDQLRLSDQSPDFGATVIVWLSCIGLHLIALFVGVQGARLFGFPYADQTAVAFASSQKTLPIGVLMADQFPGAPFAIFPMLMFHASQLFVDTMIAERRAKESQRATGQ